MARERLSGLHIPDARGRLSRRAPNYRGMHPMLSKRLFLWRLKDLETERVPTVEEVSTSTAWLISGEDERLICAGGGSRSHPVREGRFRQRRRRCRAWSGSSRSADRDSARAEHAHRARSLSLESRAPLPVATARSHPGRDQHRDPQAGAETSGLGLERIVVQGDIRNPATGKLEPKLLDVSNRGRGGLRIQLRDVPTYPMRRRTSPTSRTWSGCADAASLTPTRSSPCSPLTARSEIQSDFPTGKFHGVRLRRQRYARPRRSTAGYQQGEHHRRPDDELHRQVSRGHDQSCALRRPEPRDGRAGGARVPSHHRGRSISPKR